MMGSVFEGSRKLTIWLGEPADAREANVCGDIERQYHKWEENGADAALTQRRRVACAVSDPGMSVILATLNHPRGAGNTCSWSLVFLSSQKDGLELGISR